MTLPSLFRRLVPLGTVLVAGVASAQEPAQITAEEFEAKLGYTSGKISVKNGLARLNIPETYRYLGHEASQRLLEEAWGNPKGSGDDVLGMIVPGAVSPLSDSGWAVVITYEEDGYVDDKGAESINYAKLLKEMQESTAEENKQRKEEGYEPVSLIGWAEPPTYDSAAHKLYWAKELQFGDTPTHTLNYNVRVLGRRGVLVLNAVAGMPQLDAIKASMVEVMPFVEFGEGHRYTDFVEGTDKVAAYGIAGLVAGAVATKAGLFKVILTALVAAKKLVIVGAVAAAAAARKFWNRLRGNADTTPAA